MKKSLTVVFCVVAASFGASAETYDQSLVSPGGGISGWYDGTGNPNGGFAVDDENGIEIGLRAKLRQSPDVIDSTNGVYAVPTGAEPSSPSHAAWNYEFAIDLGPGGSPAFTLADVTASLTMTDVNSGTTVTVNALSYFPDDSGFGPSGMTTGAPGSTLTGDEWGAENSENPIFASFPLSATYDENANDTYIFTLVVDNAAGAQLATDTIDVVVGAGSPTPEPATFGLFGFGLAALGFVARKRRRA
jgi:hypothetical protein